MSWYEKLHPLARSAFDNLPYNAVAFWPFVRPDGTAGIQSRVRLWDGAHVIALDHETHEVYVIRQLRETSGGPVETVELPGGGIDPDSLPLTTARKELWEEAGVVQLDEAENDWIQLSPLRGFQPITGLAITAQHIFLLLRGTRRTDASDHEIRGVMTIPLSKLIAMDRRNEFHDPFTPYGLRRAQDWLQENASHLLT